MQGRTAASLIADRAAIRATAALLEMDVTSAKHGADHGRHGVDGVQHMLLAGGVDDLGSLKQRRIHLLLKDDNLRLQLQPAHWPNVGQIGLGLRHQQIRGRVEAAVAAAKIGASAGASSAAVVSTVATALLQRRRPVDDVLRNGDARAAAHERQRQQQRDQRPNAELGGVVAGRVRDARTRDRGQEAQKSRGDGAGQRDDRAGANRAPA